MKFHLLKKKNHYLSNQSFQCFTKQKYFSSIQCFLPIALLEIIPPHLTEVVSGLENSVHREFYIGTIPPHRAAFRFTEMKDKYRWGREEFKDNNISIDNEAFLKHPHTVNLTALSSRVCEIPICSCIE